MAMFFIPGFTEGAVKGHFESDKFLFQTKSSFFIFMLCLFAHVNAIRYKTLLAAVFERNNWWYIYIFLIKIFTRTIAPGPYLQQF